MSEGQPLPRQCTCRPVVAPIDSLSLYRCDEHGYQAKVAEIERLREELAHYKLGPGVVTMDQHARVIEALGDMETERDSFRTEVERLTDALDAIARTLADTAPAEAGLEAMGWSRG